VDGYGVFLGENHTQRVIGWTSKDIRVVFSQRVQKFLIGGIQSIVNCGKSVDIFTVQGIEYIIVAN
jgi:hypothetical protein